MHNNMSEKSKGDVSPPSSTTLSTQSVVLPTTATISQITRVVVKNPLLSASVTGLSLDDFPNKPFLLPAAPALHTTRQPNPAILAGLMNREPKSLVTVGHSSAIDTENLDEINLNVTAEDTLQQQQQQLLDEHSTDTNANSLLKQQPITTDSILSQAASSFTALPSVASNVFSTFSKRIYSGSSSRERTPFNDDANANTITQFDIQPSYIQQQPHQNLYQQQQYTEHSTPPPFYAPPPLGTADTSKHSGDSSFPAAEPLPPPEPPKFYTPAEVPTLPAPATSSLTSTGQNTYRLSAKKKIYAPIPGLTDEQQRYQQQQPPSLQSQLPPLPIVEPVNAFNTPPYPEAPINVYQTDYNSPPQHLKQVERKAGLFSLTNLVPTGVFQNLSGFVQSAADTLTQSVKPSETASFVQQTQTLSTVSQPNPAVPETSSFIGSTHQQVVPPPPTFYATSVPLAADNVAATPQANLYVPPPLSGFFGASTTSIASTEVGTNSLFAVPDSQSTISAGITTASQPVIPPASALFAVANPTTLDVLAPPPSQYSNNTQTTQSAILPPSIQQASSVPPPIGVSDLPPPSTGGQATTSFRLQKGTRLYKNPLTPQETAPINQPSFAARTEEITASIFDPYGQQQHLKPAATSAPNQTNIFQPLTVSDTHSTVFNPLLPSQLPQTTPATFGAFGVQETLNVFNPLLPPQLPQATPANFDTFSFQPTTNVFDSTTSLGNQAFNLPPTTLAVQPPPTSLPTALFDAPNTLGTSIVSKQENSPDLISTAVAASLNQSLDTKEVLPTSAPSIEHTEDINTTSATNEPSPLFDTFDSIKAPPKIATPPTAPIDSLQSEAFGFVVPPQIFNTTPGNIVQQQTIIEPDPVVKLLQTQTIEAPEVDETSCNDSLEQTLAKLSLPTAEAVQPPPPPPQAKENNSTDKQQVNPFRKDLTAVPQAQTQPNALANFFTPAIVDSNSDSSDSFNFFAPQSATTAVQSNTNYIQSVFQPVFPDLPSTIGIAPPPVTIEPIQIDSTTTTESGVEAETIAATPTSVPPPIGFDNFLINRPNISATTIQSDSCQRQTGAIDFSDFDKLTNDTFSVNSFTKYFSDSTNFNTSLEQQQVPQQQLPQLEQERTQIQSTPTLVLPHSTVEDPTTFFDNFAAGATASKSEISSNQLSNNNNVAFQPTAPPLPTLLTTTTAAANEEQRIQNFFNNPPPKENVGGAGDLNYDLVHSGLAVKQQQERSQTPASNLVEPPSSACSEFSELNSSRTQEDNNSTSAIKTTNTTITTPTTKAEKQTENVPDNSIVEGVVHAIKHYEELPEDILHELRMANVLTTEKGAAIPSPATITYTPAVHHWFYKRLIGSKPVWSPFSHYDSALLETSLTMGDDAQNLVPVEGGRYDVNIRERTKIPVYWEGKAIEVRRCSWFYKASDSKYIPYEESTAELLEAEYKQATESGEWRQKIILSMGEQVVFHGPTVIVHFQQQQNADSWGSTTQASVRPRVVRRDLDDFIIDQGESQRVDHLLFMVHGIGSACDLKLRSVEEVVDEFRSIAQQLVQSHYKNSTEMGLVGRVEVLPISWHSHLHSGEMGIDDKLKSITLESIPKLRNFTNDTLLDVLFYTSPTYCQKIMNTVAAALNEVYLKYRSRHPDFNGGVSVAGHSLGSLILFDLLCHQEPLKESEEQNMENPDEHLQRGVASSVSNWDSNYTAWAQEDVSAKQISYTMGRAGTGQPFINYAQLIFQPKKFFALGSPIGMFVTIRGIDKLGLDFRLPTCPGFYNIFHPFDPVAYRIEALVNADMTGIRPVLIPHHKGRKRMHLELKETMTRVSADLKQRFVDTFKTTLQSVNFLSATTSKTAKKEAEEVMEKEVNSVLQMQYQMDQQLSQNSGTSVTTARSRTDSVSTNLSDSDMVEVDFPLGKLNDSKRVDYVLQEAPLEFFNEYLFALSSHVCYWESEDTILFVMKEIYAGLGVSPDSQVPQQTMTIERPSSRNNINSTLLPL